MEIQIKQLHEILLKKGFNPRTDMGEPLDDSILKKGIQQPLQAYQQQITLLIPGEDGTFIPSPTQEETIIGEGHRRIYSLARILGHRPVELLAEEPSLSEDGTQTTYIAFEPDPEAVARELPDGTRIETWHKHAELPLIIREDWQDETTRLFAALSFGSSESGAKPLNMVEKGHAFLRLQQAGMTFQEIGEGAEYSATHVSDCIELVTWVDAEIILFVLADRMSPTTALDLAKATMSAPGVPDRPQQVIHFRAALAKATESGGEDARVTPKHIPIPIGKAAVTTTPATVPFQDVDSADSTVDGEGRIWRSDEEILALPEASKARATILIAARTIEYVEQFFYGYELKWPGHGKDDGYLKVLPNLKSAMFDPDRRKARLYALGSIHSELGAKDFRVGDKAAALATIEALQAEAAADFPEMHTPEADNAQESADSGQESGDSSQESEDTDTQQENEKAAGGFGGGGGDLPPAEQEIALVTVKEFFDSVATMRDQWRTLKGFPNREMPEFDKALAHYREVCRTGGSKVCQKTDLLSVIIANIPAKDCKPAALFMLQVVEASLTNELPALPTERRTIEKALTGIFQTMEEINTATL